jgi:hypothetical protein
MKTEYKLKFFGDDSGESLKSFIKESAEKAASKTFNKFVPSEEEVNPVVAEDVVKIAAELLYTTPKAKDIVLEDKPVVVEEPKKQKTILESKFETLQKSLSEDLRDYKQKIIEEVSKSASKQNPYYLGDSGSGEVKLLSLDDVETKNMSRQARSSYLANNAMMVYDTADKLFHFKYALNQDLLQSSNVYFNNIEASGNVNVGGQVFVTSGVTGNIDLTVSGNTSIGKNLTVSGNTILRGNLLVTGGTILGNYTFSQSGNTSAYATKRVLQYVEGTGVVTYSNYIDAASIYITGYSSEIHVSPVAADDTGKGTIGDPVKTIAQAQVLAALAFETTGVGQRKTIILHPGDYTENVTINTQFTVLTTHELVGKNTTLSGTLTITKGCTVDGLKMTNLVITADNTTGTVDLIGCTVTTAVTKTSSAYTVFRGCDLSSSTMSITGGGTTILNGGNYFTLTVNNAAAGVLAKSVVSMGPVTLTAGTLQLSDTLIYAAANTANAITQSAGSVITVNSCQTLIPDLTNVARNSFGGFYSILNAVYDKANSTFAGTSLSSILYSQNINADALTLAATTLSTSTATGALIVAGGAGIGGNVYVGNNITAGNVNTLGVANVGNSIVTALTASKPVFTDANKALTSSGTMPTNQGGTGLTSFTANGILYASSSSALTTGSTVVFDGTNFGVGLTPVTNNGVLQLGSYAAIKSLVETATITGAAPSATTNFDWATQAVQYYTSNATTNFTLNIRGNGSTALNTIMQTGQSASIALLVTNGATPYYPSAINIDGTASGVTVKYINGTSISSGNANSIDIYSITIIKTGSATYTVLISQTKFA